MIYILIAMVMVSYPVWAGVDFTFGDSAMMGDRPQAQVYTIPEFFSKAEAEQWGRDMKGVEPVRRALKHHMDNLLSWAHLEGEESVGKIRRSGRLMTQYAFCHIALDILDSYHKQHPNDVGADFVASSIPWRVK